MSTVVGIDPSLTATGVATETGAHTIASGPGASTLRVRHRRLVQIVHAADNYVLGVDRDADMASLVLIEAPSLGQARQGGTLDRNGLWWLLVARLSDLGVPTLEVSPATLKKYATGKGNATKADMRMAWFQRAGEDVRDDNQVDALWLRQIGLALLDDPAAIPMPAANRGALDKLALPEGVKP